MNDNGATTEPRVPEERSPSLLQAMAAAVDQLSHGHASAEADALEIAQCAALLKRYWRWPQSTSAGVIATGDSQASDEPEPTSPIDRHEFHLWPDDDDERLLQRFGRFEVRRILGHGGFGIVFLVFDPSLNREAALKLARPEILMSNPLRNRFIREAQASAVLDHPNIVPVYETGEIGLIGYILSAYCDGPTLAAWLREQREPVPPKFAAEIVENLANAVHHAHVRGILHRDIKPSNVLLDQPVDRRSGTLPFLPRLSDFGLAKRLGEVSHDTMGGTLLGTPRYMAPEQAAGNDRTVGVHTDVYALGVVLYELLTGEPPFVGDSDGETLAKIRDAELTPAALRRAGVPRDLETICLKCLEKDPSARYATAGELAQDLRRFLTGELVCARPVGRAGHFWRWSRRNPVIAILGSLLAVTLVLISVGAPVIAVREAGLRRDAQRLLTESYVDRGLALCEAGEVAPGLHWLVRALTSAPQGTEPLEYAIRANLAAWEPQFMARPRAVLQSGGDVNVFVVAFSPDGTRVLVGEAPSWARLWDAATGNPVGQPLTLTADLGPVAFSRDGSCLLTGCGDGTVQVWNATTLEPMGASLRCRSGVRTVAFSPDGTLVLAGCSDGTVWLWNATGAPSGEPLQLPAPVNAVDFSPDGSRFATGTSDGRVQLWDAIKRVPSAPPCVHDAFVSDVAFSPDGALIATASADRTARLWDAESGAAAGIRLSHPGPVRSVDWSPDAKTLLTGCGDHTARLWNAETGEPIGAPLQHRGEVSDVAFGPDGRSVVTAAPVTAHGQRVACLWDVNLRQKRERVIEHSAFIETVAVSPDGRFLLTGTAEGTAAEGGAAQLWEVVTGKPVGPSLLHPGGVRPAAVFSPDGRSMATGDGRDSAYLWNLQSGERVGRPLKHNARINAVAFSPDGTQILTGSAEDRGARLWDAETGQLIGAPNVDHQDQINSVAFSPDGKQFATAYGAVVRFWNSQSLEPLGEPLRHPASVNIVAFSPDGACFLTAGYDNTARVWNLATREPAIPPLQHHSAVYTAAFSPDGRFILTGSEDFTARIWHATTGRAIGPPLTHRRHVDSVAFSPDGTLAFTGSADKTARVWPVPAAWSGSVEEIKQRVEVLTGLDHSPSD